MLTTPLQSSLGRLPLEGACLLVDAFFADDAAAVELCDILSLAVGPKGTIVMPTFTLSRTLPPGATAFQRDLEVDEVLGRVPEVFRRQPGVLRTEHPTNSFAAVGPKSQAMLSTNRDNNPLGPLKKLAVEKALALRIGRPLRPSSALHLAEEQWLAPTNYRSSARRINIAGFEERVVVEHSARCTVGYGRLEEAVLTATAEEFPPTSEILQLIPIRVLVQQARAALTSAPEAILCGRESCGTCEIRSTVLHRER